MIDIHSHILPMLDDGAFDYDESMEMADMAARSGVRILVATPHSNQDGMYENFYSDVLQGRFNALRDAIIEEGIPLDLKLGMEIMSSERAAKRLSAGKLIGLNRGRYCLMEFWFDELPEVMEADLRAVLETGRVPVIAHPERYDCVQDEPELVEHFCRLGCKTQVNKGSVLGRFGRRVEAAAWRLLDDRLVTCIGSDAHKPYMRTTDMAEIRSCISRFYSPDYAYELLSKNPAKLIGESGSKRK